MGSHDRIGFTTSVILGQEAMAVQKLKEALEILGAEDPEMLDISIESETNFKEALERVLRYEGETAALLEGLSAYMRSLGDRQRRYKNRIEWCRTLIAGALSQAGVKKLETASATVSLTTMSPKVMVVSEAEVPAGYWIIPPPPPPTIDEKALQKALLARATALAAAKENPDPAAYEAALAEHPTIPGATLAEPTRTVTIRRK